jgi:hypothetical protein
MRLTRNDESMPVKPNFIYIGLPKTGSSWLFENFFHHPEIFVPPGKYTEYFSLHAHKSTAWYLSYFQDAKPQHRAIGEFGINYLHNQKALSALKEINKNMRFIFFVRDPLEQAISNAFHMLRYRNLEARKQIILQISAHEKRGWPSEHLQYWISEFGYENFLFQDFSDIRHDEEKVLRETYKFLDVNVISPVKMSDVKKNLRQRPRHPALGYLTRVSKRILKRSDIRFLLDRLHKSEALRRIVFKDGGDFYAGVAEELRREYYQTFIGEYDRLRAVAGLNG